MKKVLLVFMAVILVVSAVFADDLTISAGFTPVSKFHINDSDNYGMRGYFDLFRRLGDYSVLDIYSELGSYNKEYDKLYYTLGLGYMYDFPGNDYYVEASLYLDDNFDNVNAGKLEGFVQAGKLSYLGTSKIIWCERGLGLGCAYDMDTKLACLAAGWHLMFSYYFQNHFFLDLSFEGAVEFWKVNPSYNYDLNIGVTYSY